MRILTIVGTRPEAIKMVPVIKELNRHPDLCQGLVCSTGQHREMLDQVLTLFDVVPEYELDIMRPNQTPAQVAARVLEKLPPLLEQVKPDCVLVQGDTTTVMAAAIASHYARCSVGHVEAGLRSRDRGNPFPEEMNRVVTDHVSDMHFAPTRIARNNLLLEGVSENSIFVTGNTVIDALHLALQLPCPDWIQEISANRPLILVTAHRRENHGRPLAEICAALRIVVQQRDVQIVFPVHRNPRVWDPVHEQLAGVSGVLLLPPLGYLPLVHLMKRSQIVLTDSGGIQEEAPALGKPVLVLREVTERPEAVAAGAARVIGTSQERIVFEVENLLDKLAKGDEPTCVRSPYGDGRAAERIVGLLLQQGRYPTGLSEWDG